MTYYRKEVHFHILRGLGFFDQPMLGLYLVVGKEYYFIHYIDADRGMYLFNTDMIACSYVKERGVNISLLGKLFHKIFKE